MIKKHLHALFFCLILANLLKPVSHGQAQPNPQTTTEQAASASQPSTVETLTLDRALSLAADRNRQITAASKRLAEAKAEITLAKTRINPSLVTDLGFFAELTYRVSGIQQTFEPPGKRRFRILVAEDKYKQVEAEVQDTIHNVLKEVHRAYADWIAARVQARFQEKNSQELKTIAEVAKKRYGEGQVEELDVNQSMLLYLQADNEIIQARNEFERTQLVLGRLLNLQNFKTPVITSFDELANKQLPSLDSLIEQALNHRKDLQAKQAELKAEGDRLKLFKRSRIPNVTLTAGYDIVNPQANRFISGIFTMGQMEIPIFDRQQGHIERTLATQARLQEEQEALIRQIRSEIEISYRQVTYNQTQWRRFQTQLLPLADIVDRQALESYQTGKTGINDVIGQHQNAFNVRQEALSRFIAYHQSLAELEAAINKRLKELDLGY